MIDDDRHSPITPESLQLLARHAGVQLRPEEIEPLRRVYHKLDQMKALIRKPRNYGSQLAHTFRVHPVQGHRDFES